MADVASSKQKQILPNSVKVRLKRSQTFVLAKRTFAIVENKRGQLVCSLSPGSVAVVLEKLNGAVSVSAKQQRGRKRFEQRRYLQRSCETNSRSPDV